MTDDTDTDAEGTDIDDLIDRDQRRTNTTAETADQPVDRVDAITDAILAIDDGQVPNNINVRDSRLKGVLVGLEEAGELEAIQEQLANRLDRDAGEVSKAKVANYFIRVGLRKAAPDVYEDATTAHKQALQQSSPEF